MKDYRLSELKKICENQAMKNKGLWKCKDCPIQDFCFGNIDGEPRDWDVEIQTTAKIIDEGRECDWDDWIHRNAPEFWEEYIHSYGGLHNGDTVRILMSAPIGESSNFWDKEDLFYLVQKGEAMCLIHQDGLEIIKDGGDK